MFCSQFFFRGEEKMISKELVAAIKLSKKRNYQIAQEAGLHPATLSKIINGIEKVNCGDRRVLRLGQVLGIPENKLFEE